MPSSRRQMLGHRRRVGVGRPRTPAAPRRARSTNSCTAAYCVSASTLAVAFGSGVASDGTAPGRLPGDAQRLAAGGQDPHAGARRRAAPGTAGRRPRPGARSCPGAAAVPCSSVSADQRVDERLPGCSPTPSTVATACGTQARVGQRRQLDEPDAVGEVVDAVRGDLQREARLAGAARRRSASPAATSREQDLHLRHLPLAADEAGQLERQVVGARVERPERREVGRQVRREQLEDPLRADEVLQPVLAQVAQRDPGGKASRTSSCVASESRTCPPCPAASRRATRFSGGPK